MTTAEELVFYFQDLEDGKNPEHPDIEDTLLQRCLSAFEQNRGKFEWETSAIEGVLFLERKA